MATKSPKSHKVLLADGSTGFAYKLSARNHILALNSTPGSEYREQVSKSGQTSNQRLMVPINGSKKVKAAYFDDWILETDAGHQVVKFDQTETTLFFPNSFPDEATAKKGFTAWKRWLKRQEAKAAQ